MITVPLPDQEAMVISLAGYCQDVLGETHYQPIGMDRALAIIEITKNYHTCFVQLTDETTGKPLPKPVLWKFSAWADSVERNRLAKIRAHNERVARAIHAQNIAAIVRGILKEMPLTETQAHLLAHRMISKNQLAKIMYFGVTLITTEEELT